MFVVLLIVRLLANVKRIRRVRHIVSVLRLVSIPTYLQTLYAVFFGEAEQHATTMTAWLAFGWTITLVLRAFHAALTTAELMVAAREHWGELRDEEEGPVLVRTWILITVMLLHGAAICWALSA